MMAPIFLALALLAGAAPKLIYKPDPKAAADVATVNLSLPRHPCFGVVRVSVLLSSRKTDRNRVYVLNVVVADSPTPEQIKDGTGGATPLKLVNVRNGDVACTDYQCPTGSSALFELGQVERAAMARDGALPIKVHTSAAGSCDVTFDLRNTVLTTLDGWADGLAKP